MPKKPQSYLAGVTCTAWNTVSSEPTKSSSLLSTWRDRTARFKATTDPDAFRPGSMWQGRADIRTCVIRIPSLNCAPTNKRASRLHCRLVDQTVLRPRREMDIGSNPGVIPATVKALCATFLGRYDGDQFSCVRWDRGIPQCRGPAATRILDRHRQSTRTAGKGPP